MPDTAPCPSVVDASVVDAREHVPVHEPDVAHRSAEPTRLLNRNFLVVWIGQIISAFGGAIVRFAVPLYVLDVTGNVALFGALAAIAIVPVVVLGPIAGTVANRVNKRAIMVVTDALTAAVALGSIALLGRFSLTALAVALVAGLGAAGAFMSPAVSSAWPLIVPAKDLPRANGLGGMVATLASLLGPALGGVLFAQFGIVAILWVAGGALGLAALVELVVTIPDVKQDAVLGIGDAVRTIGRDTRSALRLITREKPALGKIAALGLVANLAVTSALNIGVPVLVTQVLELGMDRVGFLMSAMAVGGLVGGLLAGALGPHLTIGRLHWLMIGSDLPIVILGFVFLVGAPTSVTYVAMLVALALMSLGSALIGVPVMTFIQTHTPMTSLGMVGSFMGILFAVGPALGSLLFGWLWAGLYTTPGVILIGSPAILILIVLASRPMIKRLT